MEIGTTLLNQNLEASGRFIFTQALSSTSFKQNAKFL